MEIDQPAFTPSSSSIGDTAIATVLAPIGHLGISFPKKRPLRQDDPFFQEGLYEYKAAWLRLEDENAYIPDMTEAEGAEAHIRLTQPQACHYDRCHGERTFSNAAAYEHHYETNHRHCCQNCKKSFPGEKWLGLHIHEIHDVMVKIKRERGEKTYQCFVDGCDRVCSAPEKRRRHLIDKHQYPKSFNFNIVVTGIIPSAERTRQLQREKLLWKSREEGRQKVHQGQGHTHGSQPIRWQHQKQGESSRLQEPESLGAMDIEPTSRTTETGLASEPKDKHHRESLSSEPKTTGGRSTLGPPPKKNAFKQYRSSEKNPHRRSSVILDDAMETDVVPVPKNHQKEATSSASGKQQDNLDMDMDLLQQNMAQLMIPRSVANKMQHLLRMALPRSSATALAGQLQQRFVSLWLSRSAFPHRLALGRTPDRQTFRNFCSNFILRNDVQAPLFAHELAASPTTPFKASKAMNNATSETLGSIATKEKKVRKRSKLDWNPEADALLLELRTIQNKKWLEIGQQLNREPATCMNRFESTLNPILQDFWTPNRDKKLDELVSSSKSWPDIAQILGVHRLACMERWRQMGLRELSQADQTNPEEARSKRKEKERQQNEHTQHLEIQQRMMAQEQLMSMRNMAQNLKTVQQVDKDHDRVSWNSLLKDDQRYSHYRSWKKKARLDAFSQLYLMNPDWSAKEETILIQFVLKHGLEKWNVLAEEWLKGRFTTAQCRTCWKNLDMPVVTLMNSPDAHHQQQQRQAQPGDSAVLRNIIEPSVSQSGNQADNLTGQMFKYEEESAWTNDQQIQFWHLWNQYGQDWKLIAKSMGGNTSMASCKKYFADTTKQFRHYNGGGGSQYERTDDRHEDDEKVQESIKTLARTITQDFKRLPRRPSFSDGGNSGVSTSATLSMAMKSTSDASPTPTPSTSKASVFIWDKELSVRLQAIIRQAYKSKAIHLDEINWQWVSRRVHPDATARICKNHWKYLHDNSSQLIWKHEDIKKLEEGIRLLGPKKLTQIRDHFLPHMSKDDITRHWFRISDKATIIDEEEYYRLLEAVRDHVGDMAHPSKITFDPGNRPPIGEQIGQTEGEESGEGPQSHHWIEVERRMGAGWKRMPCRRVWESSYQYLIRHTHWTPNEDNLLLRMVKFVGRDDWFTVSKAMQIGRSPWQCRLRWCQLLDPVDLDASDLFVKGEKYC
ncbi:hypothetical protein BGX27_007885 [Mortierella sp. AM989]|nr:hypothetical protein BGX27_007885 [Mortierella sp. AM989]